MATKLALFTFKIDQYSSFKYDPKIEFENRTQPLIEAVYRHIKESLRYVLGGEFQQDSIVEVDSIMYMVTCVEPRPNGSVVIATIKFRRIENVYHVSIDIEEHIHSADLSTEAFNRLGGITNKKMQKFIERLDEVLKLRGKFERLPIIKRGRVHLPYYNVTSDERILEYDFDNLLCHKKSKFQDIKILESPTLGRTLFLDGLQNLAENDDVYTDTILEKGTYDYTGKEVLVLGGGDGAILHALYSENCKYISVAEIDKSVVETCSLLRPFGQDIPKFDKSKYHIEYDDCLNVLKRLCESQKKFDVIICDLTDVPIMSNRPHGSRHREDTELEWNFVKDVVDKSLLVLRDCSSVFQTHVTGAGNLETIQIWEQFLSSRKLDFKSRSAFVPSFMESWLFYRVSLRPPRPKPTSFSGDVSSSAGANDESSDDPIDEQLDEVYRE